MRIFISSVFGAVSLVGMATSAQSQEAGFSVSANYVSEYVFRGVTLAGEAFQPGAEVSFGNFTAGAWASVAVGEESVAFGDEIDLYAGYGWGLSDLISAEVGATLYHYPQAGGLFDIGANDAGTLEFYGGLSFDAPLAPSVTTYYDVHLEAFTAEGSASYGFDLAERTNFEIAATAALVQADGGGDYEYGSVSGTLSFNVTDAASVYANVNYGLSSENTFADTNFDITDITTIAAPEKSSAWVGVGISSSF